jgi:histidinol-phosphate aminotransferase
MYASACSMAGPAMSLSTKIETDSLPRYLGNSGFHGTALVDLATNENRLGPSPLALQAYAAAAADLFRYPDSSHRRLKTALSEHFALPPERIACGAGSDELISLLVRLFAGPGDEVLYPAFSFIMFHRYALRAGAKPVAARTDGYRLSADGILESLSSRTAIVFLANPNNPTGSTLGRSEIRRLASSIPDHIPLVLDCAYADYALGPDYSEGLDLAADFPNLIVLRTFSKTYALSSLRAGWCLAPNALVDKLDRLRGPYNLSGPAQAAAAAALSDRSHIETSRRHNSLWRARLTEEFSKLGFVAEPSGGNFMTLVFDSPQKAGSLFQFFLKRGLLTRPLEDYAMPECIRITIGLSDDNERVIEAARDWKGLCCD